MITQNAITGRSRKKLGNVYARTLWGNNIIQTCPTPSKIPPTKALRDSRSAFRVVNTMANSVPTSLLYDIYYSAPVGRSRRHVLNSQLFTGVQRTNHIISFDPNALSELGTNPVVSTKGLLYTVPGKTFSINISEFSATERANQERVPCIMAISYELQLCVPLIPYTTIQNGALVFINISDTFIGHEVILIPLWQTNINTPQNPIWVYGGFQRE